MRQAAGSRARRGCGRAVWDGRAGELPVVCRWCRWANLSVIALRQRQATLPSVLWRFGSFSRIPRGVPDPQVVATGGGTPRESQQKPLVGYDQGRDLDQESQSQQSSSRGCRCVIYNIYKAVPDRHLPAAWTVLRMASRQNCRVLTASFSWR